MTLNFLRWLLILSGIAVTVGCSKSSNDATQNAFLASVPPVAPIVNSALPTSLQATALMSFNLQPIEARSFPLGMLTAPLTDTDVKNQLETIFKATYGTLSGLTAMGYMNSLLVDLDSRIAGTKNMYGTKSPKCTTVDSQSYTIDISAVTGIADNGFKLALDLNCLQTMGGPGDQAAAGSGIAFGKNTAGDVSLWLTLNHTTDGTSSVFDGFGYAAKVTSPSSETDKSVDLIFVEAAANNSRGSIARLKAKPATQSYELIYASTQNNSIGPATLGNWTNVTMGNAIYLNSDGTNVYVKSPSVGVDTCLSASDLSASSDTAGCATLKAGFTIPAQSNGWGLDGTLLPMPTSTELTLFNAIQVNEAESVTTPITE